MDKDELIDEINLYKSRINWVLLDSTQDGDYRNLTGKEFDELTFCNDNIADLEDEIDMLDDDDDDEVVKNFFGMQRLSTVEFEDMSDKGRIIWKGIGMLLAYGAITAAVIYFLNGCTFDKWKAVTWAMFMAFGIWQSYRWFQRKVEELNDKED